MDDTGALGPIVVGASGSEDSDRAVDWATDYASMTHRRLLAVHGTGFVGVRPNAHDLLEAERVALEAGRLIVDAAVERAIKRSPDILVEGLVDVGDPPSVLIERSETAALLVVGSRRDVPFRRLFGSVSLAVTRHARCPVVVVRPFEPSEPSALPRRVVLGLDGSAASKDAVAFAFEYAALSGLHLLIVHGSWERLSRGSPVLSLLTEAEERGLTEEEELSIAETIAGLPERYPDVEYRSIHRTADPAEALIEASESAELVVVGTRRISAAKAIVFRSVSTALIEHAHSPVAVVHTESAD
jgi:nucleotide-binding universal stress UspA family protein